MADWRKKLVKAQAAGGGNYIVDGSGRLIVKDLAILERHGDEYTFVADLFVKSSQPDPMQPDARPNAPGTSVSYVQQLTVFESAAGNMKGLLQAIDPDFATLDDAAYIAAVNDLLRAAAEDNAAKGLKEGRTMPNTVCKARGYEVAYKTKRKWTKGTPQKPSHEITIAFFEAVENTEASVAENLKLLDGKV
jgi:hypothetical protein